MLGHFWLHGAVHGMSACVSVWCPAGGAGTVSQSGAAPQQQSQPAASLPAEPLAAAADPAVQLAQPAAAAVAADAAGAASQQPQQPAAEAAAANSQLDLALQHVQALVQQVAEFGLHEFHVHTSAQPLQPFVDVPWVQLSPSLTQMLAEALTGLSEAMQDMQADLEPLAASIEHALQLLLQAGAQPPQQQGQGVQEGLPVRPTGACVPALPYAPSMLG